MIAISLIENTKKIVLEIEDSGSGIPEDICQKSLILYLQQNNKEQAWDW